MMAPIPSPSLSRPPPLLRLVPGIMGGLVFIFYITATARHPESLGKSLVFLQASLLIAQLVRATGATGLGSRASTAGVPCEARSGVLTYRTTLLTFLVGCEGTTCGHSWGGRAVHSEALLHTPLKQCLPAVPGAPQAQPCLMAHHWLCLLLMQVSV